MTDDLTHTALVPLPADGGELALPDDLIERTKAYAREALAPRTRAAYARWVGIFEGWAERHGREAMPASPATVAAFLTALADGLDGGKPLARASISQALSAIAYSQRAAGYTFDRKERLISATWSGVSRVKAMTEVDRKASPLKAADVREALAMFNTNLNIGLRNSCLIAVGFSGALRRSELVGLDWMELGSGIGFVRVSELGVEIVLARSKASQDRAVSIVVPRADVPEACEALEAWAQRADLKPGDPIFRAVNNRKQIAAERLTAHSVSRIVKRVARDLQHRRGKSREEAAELVRRFSGHSLRAGFCSSAADADVPLQKIALHSRHKSLETCVGYIRQSEAWRKSALKGLLHAASREEIDFLAEHFGKVTTAERTRLMTEFEAFLAAKAADPVEEAVS
jgi:integrase